ncbi:MAG: NADH-quinone oxidoreductase subunit K [Candidatus Micrarchaeota archaeon]
MMIMLGELNFVLCALVIGVGLFGVLLRRNILKMIISLGVIDTGIYMFIISRGYVDGCSAPILEAGVKTGCMVDPIPQALTLTSIVIGASVMALGLAIAIGIYQKRGTLEVKMIE